MSHALRLRIIPLICISIAVSSVGLACGCDGGCASSYAAVGNMQPTTFSAPGCVGCHPNKSTMCSRYGWTCRMTPTENLVCNSCTAMCRSSCVMKMDAWLRCVALRARPTRAYNIVFRMGVLFCSILLRSALLYDGSAKTPAILHLAR